MFASSRASTKGIKGFHHLCWGIFRQTVSEVILLLLGFMLKSITVGLLIYVSLKELAEQLKSRYFLPRERTEKKSISQLI